MTKRIELLVGELRSEFGKLVAIGAATELWDREVRAKLPTLPDGARHAIEVRAEPGAVAQWQTAMDRLAADPHAAVVQHNDAKPKARRTLRSRLLNRRT